MKALTSLSALLLGAGVLAGCSTVSDVLESDKIDYKSAGKPVRSLEVPPDLIAPERDDRFSLPNAPTGGATSYSAYAAGRGEVRTAEATVLPDVVSDSGIRVERAGTQRWLVVPADADVVWPKVKAFWTGLGFTLTVDNPATGIMETDWAEDRAKIPQDMLRRTLGFIVDGLYSTSERDKFRTRLERTTDGGVEIYISHRGAEEIFPDEAKNNTIWQPRPTDPDLEAEMLRRMMVHLGADSDRADEQIAASGVARARLKTDNGLTRLEMDESFSRAWRRVGLALDRVGFTVEDRNREEGVYFVRYRDVATDATRQPEEKGFFSSLAFWRSGSSEPETREFRIRLRSLEGGTVVAVLNAQDQADASDASQRILALLEQELR